MNDAELDAIESCANAATPGPWEARPDGMCVRGPEPPSGERGEKIAVTGPWGRDPERVVLDCEFIARARQDVPALVAEVRRLRALAEAKR